MLLCMVKHICVIEIKMKQKETDWFNFVLFALVSFFDELCVHT